MINVLDLRLQVPPKPNGPPQNPASDGDGFAILFDEEVSGDVPCDDLAPAAWAQPGMSTIPISKSGLATPGKGAAGLTLASGDTNDHAAEPQTDAAPEVPAPVALADLPDNVGESALAPELAGAMTTVAEIEVPSLPEIVTKPAETGQTFQASPLTSSHPLPAQTGPAPDPNTARKAQDWQRSDALTAAPRPLPRDIGPDPVAPAGSTPKPDGMPVTVAQVQVTIVPAVPPVVVPQLTTRTGGALPDAPKPDGDPELDAPITTRPADPNRAVPSHLVTTAVVAREAGSVGTDGLNDGLDAVAGDKADGSPGGVFAAAPSHQMIGPAAATTAPVGGSVTAAVVAAIPPPATQTDRVEVILSPDELGRVQMDFRADGDAMRVLLTAERPETLDLLRRHADHLAAELRQAGYSGASLSFGQWGQPRGEGRHGPQFAQVPQSESHILTAAPAFSPPKNNSGQGLDLRI